MSDVVAHRQLAHVVRLALPLIHQYGANTLRKQAEEALATYEAEERAKSAQPMPGVAMYTEVQRLAERQFGLCRACDGTGETGGIIGSHYIGLGCPCHRCGGAGERER